MNSKIATHFLPIKQRKIADFSLSFKYSSNAKFYYLRIAYSQHKIRINNKKLTNISNK